MLDSLSERIGFAGAGPENVIPQENVNEAKNETSTGTVSRLYSHMSRTSSRGGS